MLYYKMITVLWEPFKVMITFAVCYLIVFKRMKFIVKFVLFVALYIVLLFGILYVDEIEQNYNGADFPIIKESGVI